MVEYTTEEFLVVIEPLIPWLMACIVAAVTFGFGFVWIFKHVVLALLELPCIISTYFRRKKRNGIRTAVFEYQVKHKDGKDIIYCNGKIMLVCNRWDNAVAICQILEEDDELFVAPERRIDL